VLTTQIMYDAIRQNAHRLLDKHPLAIGGYVTPGSQYAWTAAEWALFPNCYQVRINESHDHMRGNCLAVEDRAAGPVDIVPWLQNRMLATKDPLLIYCNRFNLAACLAERAKVHNWHGRVYMWVATLDGTMMYDRAMTQHGQLKDQAGIYADVSAIMNLSLVNQMVARIGHQ
jgi:hypothetical protein